MAVCHTEAVECFANSLRHHPTGPRPGRTAAGCCGVGPTAQHAGVVSSLYLCAPSSFCRGVSLSHMRPLCPLQSGECVGAAEEHVRCCQKRHLHRQRHSSAPHAAGSKEARVRPRLYTKERQLHPNDAMGRFGTGLQRRGVSVQHIGRSEGIS